MKRMMKMRPITTTFNKNEYDFILTEEGLTKVGANMRLTKGDIVDITFNLYRIDQDVPHTPDPIDLANKVVTFKAKQVGPTPDTQNLTAPKTITVVGVNQVPLADGEVEMNFVASDLDTAGMYNCVLIITDLATGENETCRYQFPLEITDSL